jgi:hypothetical protein
MIICQQRRAIPMKKKDNAEKEKIKQFIQENIKNNETSISKPHLEGKSGKPQQQTSPSYPYKCPRCYKALSSRKEPCKHCGFNGYIPLSEAEIKKTRFIMFFVILALAIIAYVIVSRR